MRRAAFTAGGFGAIALAVAAALVVGPLAEHPRAEAAARRTVPAGVTEAKAVAEQFFRALDGRRFGRACDLLSARFYQLNAIPSRRMCVLSLRYGMSTAGVRFRIVGARARGSHVRVDIVAEGARGSVSLVREGRSFKIVSLGGA